jgi:hypothetical protein
MMLLQLALCFSNAVKSECPLHFHLANMCTPCLFVYLNYKSNYMYMHGICWLLAGRVQKRRMVLRICVISARETTKEEL